MAGTPSTQGNPRDRIVEATISLMRRSGYSGAGLNEILKESGAPKGSMYHYFPGGKRQVAGEALEAYARQILAMFDESLSTGRTPGAKVRALFDARAKRLEKSAFRMSCAAGATCLDLEEDLEAGAARDRQRLCRLDRAHFEAFQVRRQPPHAVLCRVGAHRNRRRLHPRTGRAFRQGLQGSGRLARRDRRPGAVAR